MKDIIVETYLPIGENSGSKTRVRPLPGQWAHSGLKVECSKAMRERYPVGTKFRINARLIDREGTPLLYSHYNADYKVVSEEEAAAFISG
ncbi:MAG TPA: hypothetical protein VGE29_08310 [Prosthecobacter sp.]